MPDEVLPDAPMAVIPGADGGMLDFLSPKSTFPQEDEEASAPSSEPRSQQASTFEYLSDAQFDAMLVANSATPPPFETVNPSALSSPGPATDFSSSDDGMAMHNPSPFQPANYQFFDTDSIRSTPFTTNMPPLSAPIARRYSRHLSLHDGAHTEPHTSPVGFPLNEQSPEPPADQPPGMYFTLHRQLQARLMQEDDGNQSRNYYQSQPHTVALGHNQAPRADGLRHVPSPTPSPHPYPPAQPHHQQHPASPSAPPQAQITFHRQSGHYIGQPRPRRHPYPPAAPRQAQPPNGHQTPQGHTAAHPAQDQPGNAVDNMNLLSMRGTVRIGTPVAPPPPPPATTTTPMPADHPPPSTITMANTSSPTPASPPPSSGPASSPGPASPRARPQQQHQRDGDGGSSGSNDDDGSTSTSTSISSNTNIRTSSSSSSSISSRTRSNTAPTPPSSHHSRAVSSGRMHQQSVRGVDRMGNHRRGVGSNVRSGTPGPTSAPMVAKKSMMGLSSTSSAAHVQHQRMWTPEPAAAAAIVGGGAFAEGVVGEGRVRPERTRTRRGQDTLVLGIQAILERIGRECDGLNEWVREAVEVRGEGEEEGELERKRLEKRNKNFAVTELDGPLEPLPRSMQLETGLEDIPWDVPPNAQGIRNLDHDGITPLLEVYSIPFQPEMFLGQKKELYLRFIGANRTLMHRVLD
ncbi:hypothetical protein SLS58_001727 [Diplodia intermedia]|uniref:Uncharacterized protein n=1 Tax=Diplodia intermedia TaxID=856260 RepID=A0ABR3U1L2_9PEZI